MIQPVGFGKRITHICCCCGVRQMRIKKNKNRLQLLHERSFAQRSFIRCFTWIKTIWHARAVGNVSSCSRNSHTFQMHPGGKTFQKIPRLEVHRIAISDLIFWEDGTYAYGHSRTRWLLTGNRNRIIIIIRSCSHATALFNQFGNSASTVVHRQLDVVGRILMELSIQVLVIWWWNCYC